MQSNNSNITEISLDGFQVVRGQYFSRIIEPSFTIWYSGVSFNLSAYNALNSCESVQILVSNEKRCIIIKSVPSTDRDAVVWLKPSERHKYKKIECSKFTHQLYDFWNWNKGFHYRANGKLVKSGQKIMLYFDFTKPEEWEGSKLVSDFGG